MAWELASRFQNEGARVSIIVHRMKEFSGLQNGIKFKYAAQLPKIFGSLRSRSFAWLAERAARHLAQGGLVHGFGDSCRQDILSLGNADWTYAGRIPQRKPSAGAMFIKNRALGPGGCSRLVVISKQMRDDVIKRFEYWNNEKLHVIYPGVDGRKYHPGRRHELRRLWNQRCGLPLQAKWIVFAAGGDFEKRNFKTIAEVLSKIAGSGAAGGNGKQDEWVFVVVGAQKNQVVMPAVLERRSFFTGRLPDLSDIFPACDLMVYPAWYDEFALVCLEAMSSGVPVILSRQVGASEILPEKLRQICVLDDPADSQALAGRIEGWLKGSWSLSADEVRKVAEPYSWERFYQTYKELYQEVFEFKKMAGAL
ncbi:MAG: glycosyltransferase family 4 protein [Elusimicrobia bacterium]|nr:glycosyltransferase family 4 protein [Elusimicrobiota bacterium]